MELNNIIFSFFILFIGYFINKFFLLNIKNNFFNSLIDNQFSKPQAFHEKSTYRIGGLTIFLLLILVFIYLFLFKNIYMIDYMSFCTLFFILGLIDDMKITIAPKLRLLSMLAILIPLIIFNSFFIEKTGLNFLNNLLEIDIFALFFVCLCFLFIINGANLIDGYNGLLSIHAIIILTVLFFINLINGNNDISQFLFFSILLILIFLKFNFPKAQMFLGDGGAYLVGCLIAISIIKTSILNPTVHPFFFCTLLFYLFFEVFFSFVRKTITIKSNPLFPDSKHLHMLLYKILLKRKSKMDSNYLVSIYINLIYLFLIIPGIVFMDNGLFCRYYFLSLMIIYILIYIKFKKYLGV